MPPHLYEIICSMIENGLDETLNRYSLSLFQLNLLLSQVYMNDQELFTAEYIQQNFVRYELPFGFRYWLLLIREGSEESENLCICQDESGNFYSFPYSELQEAL